MLMLRPPGCGSTYRYLLPRRVVRKHTIGAKAPDRRMRGPRMPVYIGIQGRTTTFRTSGDFPDLPHGAGGRGAMMARPCLFPSGAPEPVHGC
ncbi:hypothetical protein GCM10020367_31840 [Streptomyces sannanensis]|uniref:Uncharacterized protein n=1 Tax=Streptomyces sannanensis TaxID=285536 RepID=A0ABP6SD07_9ACTN